MSGRMGGMLRGLDAWLSREEPDVASAGAAEIESDDSDDDQEDEEDEEDEEDDGESFTPAATAH